MHPCLHCSRENYPDFMLKKPCLTKCYTFIRKLSKSVKSMKLPVELHGMERTGHGYDGLEQWFAKYGLATKSCVARPFFMGRDLIRGNVQKMYIFHSVCTFPKTIVGLFVVPNPTLYIATPVWKRARYMLFIPMV